MLYAGESLVCAVHEIAVAAVFAIPAIAAEKAHADALADVPAFDAGADDIDLSNRFVTRHSRILDRQEPIHCYGVRMAHAAGFDADTDVPCGRIKQWLFGELQLAFAHHMDCAIVDRFFATSLSAARCYS